jgi:hypothetical protein
MTKQKATWKQRLALLSVSIGLVLLVLLGGELYCRWFTRINFLDNSRGLMTANRFGTSYGNTPNYNGWSFGQDYTTDANGFRFDPQFKSVAEPNAPGVLIIGDSVSFGPAVKDDVTIAGWLRRGLPQERIYNASAIGYDALDYKNAVGTIVPQKPEIKTVVLFFCLNDVNEDSAAQIKMQTKPAGVPVEKTGGGPVQRVNDFLRSRSKLYLWAKNALRDTSLIYFQFDRAYYQKGDQLVADSLLPIKEIKTQLDAAGVALKVFVLPYEAQTRPGTPPDFLEPQKRVDADLKQFGIDYYDTTPDFQAAGADARYLFLYGDPMHLSATGHRMVAGIVCGKLPGCKLP